MAINLWNYLSVGIEPEFKIEKVMFWYEAVPGLAFKAVWFGRKRKRLFSKEIEYLVIYRNDVFKESHCHIEWIPISRLVHRNENLRIDRDMMKLYDMRIPPSLKDAVLNLND